jgi:hypothetical protein
MTAPYRRSIFTGKSLRALFSQNRPGPISRPIALAPPARCTAISLGCRQGCYDE